MIIDTEFNSVAALSPSETVEGAILAERQGLGCVWKGEGNNREPLVLLSAMAARTQRVCVGTGVAHLLGRSPVTMALEAATLNDLSGGRFILGLGVANETVARWHGVDFGKPIAMTREYVAIIRAAYAGERLSRAGDRFRSDGFRFVFEPSPHPLRLWFGALGPKMVHLAGELADGIIVNVANDRVISEIAAGFADGAREAGRGPASLELAAKVRISLNEDVEKARGVLKRVLTFFCLSASYRTTLVRMGWEQVVDRVSAGYQRGGFREARAQIPDEMLDDMPMYAGSDLSGLPRRLQAYAEAGATRLVVAYVPSGGDAWGETRDFVERAGELTHAVTAKGPLG